jgi:hypothetical protein
MNVAILGRKRHELSQGAGGGAAQGIDLGASVQTFSAADFKAGDRTGGEIASSPQAVYVGGKTLFAYPMKWDGIYSTMGLMAVYDKNNGYYPAPIEISAKGAEVDRHMTPKIAVREDGTFLVVHERTHSANIFAHPGAADLSKFPIQPVVTATAARHNLYRTASGWALIHQQADDNLSVFTLNADGSTWSASSQILTSTSASRPYPARPFGPLGAINGKFYIIVIPQYISDANFRVKFVLVTEDFVTYTNIAGGGAITAGTPVDYAGLNTLGGYVAVGATNGTVNHGNMATVLTPLGELFIFSLDQSGASTSTLITTTYEGGVWVHRTCVTSFTFSAPNAVDTNIPSWAAARSSAEIYLMISIDGKPHIIKTIDKGTTWSDITGDMLPGKTYYRGQGPFNTHDIPDNENFAIFFIQDGYDNVSSKVLDMYAVKAAFGTLQTETSTPFTDTLTALSDIAGARFIYESDDWDSTVTGFFDKSGNARTGAKIGTPTVVSGAIAFNGTNQGIEIGTPGDFGPDDHFSFSAVAKWVSGTGFLFAFSTLGQANRRCNIMLSATGATVTKLDVGATRFEANVVYDSTAFHIIQVDGDGRHYRVYVNGVEMIKDYSIAESNANFLMSLNGSWCNEITSGNSARIASVNLTTDLWGAIQLKEAAYYPSVISRTDRKKQLNFLAAKYGISITNNVE